MLQALPPPPGHAKKKEKTDRLAARVLGHQGGKKNLIYQLSLRLTGKA